MEPVNQQNRPETGPLPTGFDLFVLVLSWFSLFNLVLLVAVRLPEIRTVVLTMEMTICLFFLADFLIRLWCARSKRDYFIRDKGWLDLLGSLPVPGLRLARLPRMRQVGRALRRQGVRQTGQVAVENLASSSLWAVVFLTIIVLQFGSMGILRVERGDDDANIKSASDALWWSYATITTVGYGDLHPVTDGGRVIGVALLTIGVGLFGVLTGFVANAFLAPSRRRDEALEPPRGPDSAELYRLIAELREEVTKR